MQRWLRLCLPIILLSLNAYAIDAVVSHAVFYFKNDKGVLSPYVEVYWQIDPNSLHFTKDENGRWYSKIKTELSFSNNANKIKEDRYLLQTTPTDSLHIHAQPIIETHRYELPEGKFNINLQLSETAYANNYFSYSDSVVLNTAQTGTFFSDIQLLDTAYESNEENAFTRNGKQQIPLCANFLNDERGNIHFYTELYQSDLAPHETYPLTIKTTISKRQGESMIGTMQHTDTITASSIFPVISHLNIRSLPSGNYFLNVQLQNKDKQVLASTYTFFQRSNAKPAKENAAAEQKDTNKKAPVFEKVTMFDLNTTFVGKFSVSQLRAVLKMISPIGSPAEVKTIQDFLRKPEETYMRYFIYNFWKTRNDADPEKAWLAYTDKIREINKLFGKGLGAAYETDRGSIYLKYGKPNERITVENEQGALPYEVWLYNAPGNQSYPGVFLFYRPGYMVNDYRLLHSTVKGEIRNTNWRSSLYTTGAGSGNTNSRAEQYLQGNK